MLAVELFGWAIGAEVFAGGVGPPEGDPNPVLELLGHDVKPGQPEAVAVGQLEREDLVVARRRRVVPITPAEGAVGRELSLE